MSVPTKRHDNSLHCWRKATAPTERMEVGKVIGEMHMECGDNVFVVVVVAVVLQVVGGELILESDDGTQRSQSSSGQNAKKIHTRRPTRLAWTKASSFDQLVAVESNHRLVRKSGNVKAQEESSCCLRRLPTNDQLSKCRESVCCGCEQRMQAGCCLMDAKKGGQRFAFCRSGTVLRWNSCNVTRPF